MGNPNKLPPRHGLHPVKPVRTQPPAERFWAKVDVGAPTSCWLWKAARRSNGYGHMTVWENGVKRYKAAHRIAFEFVRGMIPEGLELDHLCRNRLCVNPAHLEPVTGSTNLRRGIGVGGDRGTPRDPNTGRFISC